MLWGERSFYSNFCMAGRWEKETSEGQELSLRALTEAFSEAMGRAGLKNPPAGEQPKCPEADSPNGGDREGESFALEEENEKLSEESQQSRSETSTPPSGQPDTVEISPLSILEAMLFVGDPQNRPIRPETAASIMRNVQPEEIPDLVRELNRRYEAAGCPYHIVSEGPGYRMTLRKPYWHLRNRFYTRIRETRLSQAAVDVLAIVAYQQPITAEQVQLLRGKSSGHILTHLVQRQLLRVERSQDASRKAYYYTTDRFLALFGLESLEDLPKTEDIEKK